MCLLKLDLKSFRSWVRRKRNCVKKETVDILIKSRKNDRKIMQPIRITSEPATRMRKWNQPASSHEHLPK